jgi:putative SOS response-associated peptidase YedK
MPVILPRDAEAAWLDSGETRATAGLPLLQPFLAEAMAAHPMPTAVNDPRNGGTALSAPALLDC